MCFHKDGSGARRLHYYNVVIADTFPAGKIGLKTKFSHPLLPSSLAILCEGESLYLIWETASCGR